MVRTTDRDLIDLAREMYRIVADQQDNPWTHSVGLRNVIDLIEVMASRRPLYLIRGYDENLWEDHVLTHAADWGLQVVETLPWYVRRSDDAGWPEWMKLYLYPDATPGTVIVRSDAVVAELEEIDSHHGYVTVEQEARLLGFPLCCVRNYHARDHAFVRNVPQVYRSAGHDDIEIIKGLIVNDQPVPTTPAVTEAFLNGYLAPVSSFAYCDACARNRESPGQRLNHAREQFMQRIAPKLIRDIKRSTRGHLSRRDYVQAAAEGGLIWSRDVRSVIPRSVVE